MKNFTLTFMVTFLCLVSFASYVGARPIEVTNPETGITCVSVQSVWSETKIPAGCYTGDIHGPHNKISAVATKKYQSNF